ncbi:4-diphosphocytidyl-2-C-methyl-D-erythritol kinase [Aureimonas altamirensis DSM 21988]|uniref:4-diphosphocytidyl-2-C-methyl-D-erythritol kinase n=1 Tax=Aureimonas altamirensis DSM 21988 TaxID=1121026 RepID=A0ABY1IJY7_9HYPH|nr:4-(cytidine 5'-diphospho)-2-C-methyl-D-erythritol kinase [Aureimonas altamirensis]SHJ27715.1 4-diphosphocytidyl-2-C-methyl-D-erythritol kinase [Aureimonas altamirensis DSM 21988]
MAADAATGASAHAKINLALHVVGKRADGYHLLDSLVAFADVGDRLTLTPADADALHLSGPFGPGLEGHDNIVARALALARRVAAARGHTIGPLSIELEKNLPVASGIGGGSADAAAVLRALMPGLPRAAQDDLVAAALGLGADVPMCLDGRALVARGIGEMLSPLPQFPALPMVLANPGVAISTPAIFKALPTACNGPLPEGPVQGFDTVGSVVSYLRLCRNDLAAPAISVEPVIGACLKALQAAGAARSAMSGSGATCYGVFEDASQAQCAAGAIAAANPGWWVRATVARPTHDRSAA